MPEEPFLHNTINADVIEKMVQAQEIRELHVHGASLRRPQEGPVVRGDWAGRDEILDALERSLTGHRPRPVAIAGESGSGKSAVAAMLIDRLRPRFPDGQLYIDLESEDISQAMHSVLLRLGLPSAQIPSSLEGMQRLYQSATRDSALLIALDGATRAREAQLFRPASPRSGYIVVASAPMAAAEFDEHVVGPLAPDAAAEFLRASCPNVSDEVARRLIDEFGGAPATLRLLAGLVRHRSLTGLVEVREVIGRSGTADGARLFDGIYDGLSESARWLYRLLGALPHNEFERTVIDVFTGSKGWDPDRLPEPLGELVDAQLVAADRPGWYRLETGALHDAADRARTEPVPVELYSAMRDSLGWYVRRAQQADVAIMGDRQRYAPRFTGRVEPPDFGGSAEAVEWFRTMRTALPTAVRIAALHGWANESWALAEALWAYFSNISQHRHAAFCYRTALAAAPGPVAEVQLSTMLAMSLTRADEFVEAGQVLQSALTVAEGGQEAAHDTADEQRFMALRGTVTEMLGRLYHRQRRFDEAIAFFEMALVNAEERGRARAAGIQLRCLGEVRRDRGQPRLASRDWLRAAARFEEAGDARNLAETRLELALLDLRDRDPDRLDAVDQVVSWVSRLGLWESAGRAHEAVAALLQGTERRERLEAALECYAAHGALIDADRLRHQLEEIS
jgi:tetratricopeptide (TPR) repeat protein